MLPLDGKTEMAMLRCTFGLRSCNRRVRRHCVGMHLSEPGDAPDTPLQRRHDLRRLLRAFNLSLAAVLLLCALFALQGRIDLSSWMVQPWSLPGLAGLLGAPLLHGSIEHLLMNGIAILMLGTLAGGVYPRATLRALPILWLLSGLGAWLLGDHGSHHLGASGVTHGLAFLVFTLGLLRRDRAAIAAGLLAFLFYGGMLLTILPRELDVSWQSHLGGALGGVLAAVLFRRSDPMTPRQRYSWELEDEEDEADDELELSAPDQVPVLWHRDRKDDARGAVLPFRRRDE